MRKFLTAVAAMLAVGGMAACTSNGPDEATVTVTKSPVSSSTTKSSSTSAPPAEQSDERPAAQPADSPEIESYVPVSTEVSYQCPQTDAFVADPSMCTPEYLGAEPPQDLSTIPFADGGTCPAYKCGYGHDEFGNPNPTSGELQGQDGCETGYITDPDYCAAVAAKTGN